MQGSEGKFRSLDLGALFGIQSLQFRSLVLRKVHLLGGELGIWRLDSRNCEDLPPFLCG